MRTPSYKQTKCQLEFQNYLCQSRCNTNLKVRAMSSTCCNFVQSSVKCSISLIIFRTFSSLAAKKKTKEKKCNPIWPEYVKNQFKPSHILPLITSRSSIAIFISSLYLFVSRVDATLIGQVLKWVSDVYVKIFAKMQLTSREFSSWCLRAGLFNSSTAPFDTCNNEQIVEQKKSTLFSATLTMWHWN